MSIQVESDLKDILNKFDQKLDKLDRKLDKLGEDVTDINLRLTKVETKLDSDINTIKEDIKEIKGSQKAQIWTLIGVLITAVGGACCGSRAVCTFIQSVINSRIRYCQFFLFSRALSLFTKTFITSLKQLIHHSSLVTSLNSQTK